jgi:hypothetical protein
MQKLRIAPFRQAHLSTRPQPYRLRTETNRVPETCYFLMLFGTIGNGQVQKPNCNAPLPEPYRSEGDFAFTEHMWLQLKR